MKRQESFRTEFVNNLRALNKEQREIFSRIYKASETVGRLSPPREMEDWITKQFGSVSKVKVQDFIKVMDIVTYEGASFNELRLERPMSTDENLPRVIEELEKVNDCTFCNPLISTPADTFGRVRGKYCVTASNVAKYDGLHGLIIFDKHNPLLFSRKRVRDYFEVAQKWFKKANASNKKNIYPFFMWNCLWKAGASMVHGHCQLTLSEDMANAKIEFLRKVTERYLDTYKSSYFDDLFEIHKNIGLAFKTGDIKVITKITPVKEKEIMMISHRMDHKLADIVSDTLNIFKEKMGVLSFNVSITLPPMANTPEKWDHLPLIVRIVDRGKLSEKTSDFGGMELYAQSIIGSNPYTVHRTLKEALKA